jgi:hypothetical protein
MSEKAETCFVLPLREVVAHFAQHQPLARVVAGVLPHLGVEDVTIGHCT